MISSEILLFLLGTATSRAVNTTSVTGMNASWNGRCVKPLLLPLYCTRVSLGDAVESNESNIPAFFMHSGMILDRFIRQH